MSKANPTIILVMFVIILIAVDTLQAQNAQQPAAAAATTGAASTAATAQPRQPRQPRIYDQNGIRYQETRQMVQVPDIKYVDQLQTFYAQRFRTDTENRTFTRLVPRTEYECVARLHDWWRVLGQPYVAYHNEPYTTWQRTTETRAVPVTRREVVPQQRTVKVAVPYMRTELRDSWVAIGPAPGARQQIAAAAPVATPTPQVAANPRPPQQLPATPPVLPQQATRPTYVPPAQVNPQLAGPTNPPLQLPRVQPTPAPPTGPVPRYSAQASQAPLRPNNVTPPITPLNSAQSPGYIPSNRAVQNQQARIADPYSNRGFPSGAATQPLRNPAFGAAPGATGTTGGLRGFSSLGSAKHLEMRSQATSRATTPQPYNWPAASASPQRSNLNSGNGFGSTNPIPYSASNAYGSTSASRYGGIARLDGDPPRVGTTISRDTTFQAKRQ